MKRLLRRTFNDAATYLLLDIFLPGGVLMALIVWLYRHSA
jgi:hypothetical protein